jgi:NAD(P)-dependent dehydrogenase (short-subunit alcohol dehydrogenase family)
MNTSEHFNGDRVPVALITGISRGLGRALAIELLSRGWTVVGDARNEAQLASDWPSTVDPNRVLLVAGDIQDPSHRAELLSAAYGVSRGRLALIVNNASSLGPSPLPALSDTPLPAFEDVLDVNVVAPLALIQGALPALVAGCGVVVNVSSDAAVEAYTGWGGYGASKAALDHLSAVLGTELDETGKDVRVYAFDPGDMRTDMHQAAFPGEDISDRPDPDSVLPALLALLRRRPPSGRYRAADIDTSATDASVPAGSAR